MKRLLPLLLLLPLSSCGQTEAVFKSGVNDQVTEDLVFPAARTLTLSGIVTGTPASGMLNLANLTLTLPTNFTWAGVLVGANGGTGVANTGKTLTLGGNLVTSGAFGTTLTVTNTTSVTLPVSGTLATLAGTESLSNKTLVSPNIGTASGTSIDLTGVAQVGSVIAKAGTSVVYAKSSGVLYQSITPVGNITTGEDDLIQQTIAANVLDLDGDRLRITAVFTGAATSNLKRIKLKFGSTTVYDSGSMSVPASALAFRLEAIITRTSATTQNCYAFFHRSDTTGPGTAYNSFTTAAETLSGAVILKCTGEASATDDISQKEMLIEYLPVP